ncbi:beta-N-acetylhexosaminidase, partial [Streptomyces sp. SID1328]|uniref:beta-N-acetylhexosaminidase n=1 Tax=Streptomyces sp. SID1328 TaxID=2690250 RepID=UPI0031F85C95
MPELIPAPAEAYGEPGEGFALGPGTGLAVVGEGAEGTARWLRATLGAATGFPLPPADGTGENAVRLTVDPLLTGELGAEGYRLDVTPTGADLRGGGPAGLFWGAQTLRQLLGPDAFRRAPLPGRTWRLPPVRISDTPRFGWRGLLLDVARHFMPKEGVLRYLDLLAAHKLNVLHLHLTDDQGWRIEIERHPRLTEIGSWRARTKFGHRSSSLWEAKPHGGHYTRDDIREIVSYAAERHITVVPEIDLPGHSQAAIAAYPELGNTDAVDTAVDTAAVTVRDDWGISPHVLAPTEAVLEFYEGVLEEVLALFPSPFVHLGGDECPPGQWRKSATARARAAELGLADVDGLRSWFAGHFGAWLAARGRR